MIHCAHMAQNFHALLMSAGLLPSEAKIYLAARELGSSTAQNLATKAKISRTATYEAIELLQQRGLVSVSTIGKKHLFSAEDPERIVAYLKKKQQQAETTLHDIERSVEGIRLLSGGSRPIMKVYEGEEALHAYFSHVANVKPREWFEISNLDDVSKYIDEKTLNAARKALAHIPVHRFQLLYKGKNPLVNKHIQSKYLPSFLGDFHGNVSIYDQYIALVTYVGKITCIIIESAELAETLRFVFSLAWTADVEK